MSARLQDLPAARPRTTTTPAQRLESAMAATKVAFTWLGVRKTLSSAQKERAADSFAAEAKFLSAAKKLLDTRHDAFQAVTAVRGRVLTYWKALTLPYPEPGILILSAISVTLPVAGQAEDQVALQEKNRDRTGTMRDRLEVESTQLIME